MDDHQARGHLAAKEEGEVALATMPVLLIDCQSTGANPTRGHLLELAWGLVAPDADDQPALRQLCSDLVALPEGVLLPRRISQLTGIVAADLEHARSRQDVWRAFVAACAEVEVGVVHFARFERPFLAQLAEEHHARLELEILCTHTLAKRLLPDLPRRGLRALAGYFGHVHDDFKRASAHVEATLTIWRGCLEMLADEHDVRTRAELERWLEASTPQRGRGPRYMISREQRLALPKRPGVYVMKGRLGNVLYVGKATSLHDRVNSYFRGRKGKAEKTLELLSQVHHLETTECETAIEAALLESDLIKAHEPPYNIALRSRERRLGCVDPDTVGWRADGARLGPIVHPELLALWGPLRRAEAPLEGLVTLANLEPERACLEEAYALYREQENLGQGDVALAELLAISRAHWEMLRVRRFEAELAKAQAEDEDELVPDEDDVLEGDEVERESYEEVVARHLSDPWYWLRQIRHSVHEGGRRLRRSKWLLQLAESRIWFQPDIEQDQLRELVVVAGQLSEASWVERVAAIDDAPAPGWCRPWRARQEAVDLAAYDRLSVLSGELKRCLNQGQRVVVRLSPGCVLEDVSLRRALYWF